MLISVSVLPAHAQMNTFCRVDVSLQKSNTPTLHISVQHSVDVFCLNHGKEDLDSRDLCCMSTAKVHFVCSIERSISVLNTRKKKSLF